MTTFNSAATIAQNSNPVHREGRVRCITKQGFHNIAYRDWGNPHAATGILCVHGLTRNSSDFDPLAASLSKKFRVVCPDLAGRGKSEWLSNPSDYNLLQYNMDMVVLAAKIGFDRYDLIGTSLGGLMGIALAGIENSPIRRLVVNDVAPEIPYSALNRIAAYGGHHAKFPDLESVERHLRLTLAPFAPMTDDDWKRIAKNSTRMVDDQYLLHQDPEIFRNFSYFGLFTNFDLWRQWDNIKCPVLILRGKDSDFLTKRLFDRMKERLPTAEAIEFEDVGHTPTLNATPQIQPIIDWLGKG